MDLRTVRPVPEKACGKNRPKHAHSEQSVEREREKKEPATSINERY
jgi:hypothetical protein